MHLIQKNRLIRSRITVHFEFFLNSDFKLQTQI